MTFNEVLQMIAAGGGGVLTTGALSLLLIKRWIGTVDTKFKELTETIDELKREVNSLRTDLAVASERQANLNGRLDQIAKSVDALNKSVGRLHGAIQKFWIILKTKGLAPKRFSDECLKE